HPTAHARLHHRAVRGAAGARAPSPRRRGGRLSPIMMTPTTTDEPDWPDELAPADCPITLRTERLIDAPPERGWSWLVRTDVWPDWFQGVSAVRATSGRDLSVGARVRWWMMGAPAHATIRQLRANE